MTLNSKYVCLPFSVSNHYQHLYNYLMQWDAKTCRMVKSYRRFERQQCLHLQCKLSKKSGWTVLARLFDPEDGQTTLILVCTCLPVYTTSHATTLQNTQISYSYRPKTLFRTAHIGYYRHNDTGDSACDLYWEIHGSNLESVTGLRTSVVFPHPLRQIPGYSLKLYHERLHSHVSNQLFTATQACVRATDRVIK